MTRRTKGQYSPSLFDVAQDIIGGLPIKLIEQWLGSEQTHADARRLLQSFQVKGYNVVSDSAGLTRLSQQRGLIEILALIDQPKQLVHGLGTALGGRGVGIWAADNTQMFYPPSVRPESLVSMLLTVQDEIHRDCQIRIGLGAHFGEFYGLSGGLYGAQSDAIEELAENHTEGGEVVITQALRELLPGGHAFTLEPKDAPPSLLGPCWVVVDGPRLADLQRSSEPYPIPYSQAFHADLLAYQARLEDSALGRHLADKYLQHKTVVLIEREAQQAETPELALFDNLSLSAKMKDTGLRHLASHQGEEVKVVGPLGIYVFDTIPAALGFAQLFRRELEREDISCRIGIDAGPVLLFDLPSGGRDIAGMPVNIASKMAQDLGLPGRLYLSEAVAEHVNLGGFTERRATVSGVALTLYEG
jgi:class 3 adenylate cyclase